MAHFRAILALSAGICATAPSFATMPPTPRIVVTGPVEVVFNPKTDACDGYDVPDVPPRLYRDDQGNIRLFTLHFENRALIGKSLDSLKIDCNVVFRGKRSDNPAAYDDRSWIAATWTPDGRVIHGLIHHEFQANAHPGRCVYKDYMPCWYNTVLGVRSNNRGEVFEKAGKSPVVASSPFEQHIGQGRHRGFFNPSNIVSDGVWHYMMASTTGWAGQPGGVCLFRTDNIADSSRWRAWSGSAFDVKFGDPYKNGGAAGQTCRALPPFPAPVGSIVRHTASKQWIAVFQAAADGKTFATAGIYAVASTDLMNWGAPQRLIETNTLYDNPCGAGFLHSYPTLIDKEAKTRNFEDIGDTPDLYLSRMRVDGCKHTSDRTLIRTRVKIGFK